MTRIDPHSPLMWKNPEQHDIRKRHPCRGLPCRRACYTFMWYLFCKVLKKWSRSPGWHRDSVYNGSEDPQDLSFQPQWLGFVACLPPSARLRFESHGDSPENSGNPRVASLKHVFLWFLGGFQVCQDSLPWSLPDSQAPRLPALLFNKWFHILLRNQRLADKLTNESWIEATNMFLLAVSWANYHELSWTIYKMDRNHWILFEKKCEILRPRQTTCQNQVAKRVTKTSF